MATCVIGRLALRGVCSAANATKKCHAWKHVRAFSVSSKVLAQTYFTKKHEWVKVDNSTGTVGITDYAQEKLGELVYAQLPEVGSEVEADSEAGVLESVKAASEVYTPVSGVIIEQNESVADNPKLINESPEDEGWLFKLTLTKPEELEELELLDKDVYNKYCKDLD